MDGVRSAFLNVKREVELTTTGKENKGEILKALFLLNNEIGKVAKEGRFKMARMRSLQLNVNAITMGVKHGDRQMVDESIRSAGEMIEALMQE